MSRREVLAASVPPHLSVFQTTSVKGRYRHTGGIENKTYIQGNTSGDFCA